MSAGSALEVFGFANNVDDARSSVLRSIREARSRAGIQPHELGRLIRLANPFIVDKIENGTVKPSSSEILSMMAILGVPLDRVLPLEQLDADMRNLWSKRMQQADAGPVAHAEEGELDPDISLGLFIRLTAIRELFPSSGATSK